MSDFTADTRQYKLAQFVAAIKAHAVTNYEKDGWDIVVECYSSADIWEIIKTARTIKGAIRMVRAEIKPRADYRAEIQSEVF